MSNRDMVNQIFERLAAAPNGLDCKITEVLAACGMFVSAILNVSFGDRIARQDMANRFCQALQAHVDPTKLTQSSQSLH